MRNSEQIWQIVDGKRDDYIALADRVWGMPELAYGEHRSVAEHTAMLEQEGFRVSRDVAGIPTAVMGEAGEDGPVIAILGEYDALPGLSQEAGVAEPRGATCAVGTPFHSWQLTAQGKSPTSHKGLVHVAKVMAGTAIDAVQDPALIARAKADLAARTRATPYVCPLPDDVNPPIAAMSRGV